MTWSSQPLKEAEVSRPHYTDVEAMAQKSNVVSRRQGQDFYPGLLDFQVQICTYCTVEAPRSVLPVGSVWGAGHRQWWHIILALGNIRDIGITEIQRAKPNIRACLENRPNSLRGHQGRFWKLERWRRASQHRDEIVQRHRGMNFHSDQKWAWSEEKKLKTSLRSDTEELYTAWHNGWRWFGPQFEWLKGRGASQRTMVHLSVGCQVLSAFPSPMVNSRKSLVP